MPDYTGGTGDTCYAGSNADFATAHSTATHTYAGAESYVGCWPTFFVFRSFFLFDTSGIPDDATITQVNLTLTKTAGGTQTNFDVLIVKQNWAGKTREEAYDECLTADLDDSIFANSANISTNTPKTSGNLSTTWINKTGTTYYSILSSLDRSNTQPANYQYLVFASANHATAGYRPVLTVTYTEAASGALLKVNFNAQMQSLTGGFHG